ncbi:hypothetical protein B0H19DRAFT_1344221 [Mycena capillaripes]|nr:hypothetical protein B0H19DRAFT_1344221 [Mycena capillaripes]
MVYFPLCIDQLLGLAQTFMENQHAVSHAAQENPEDEEHYRRAAQHAANNTVRLPSDPIAYSEEHRPLSDEEADRAKDAHQKIYHEKADVESMGSDAVGGAVITQVMKTMSSSGGGGGTDQLMSMAFTEASKLLGGGADPGFKGEVMQKVAMMALKSQLSGGGGGGGMMTILQKFM